ncbi:helix-turn-helix domain-containing protein [Cellulosimicrobium protaetiae]|uniref:Helix-turn-helix transcriptional regulator n=1 Tax=Cellulosimicrobium protaetiae TaxID=2587808 RepID=A0A6M5UDG6_9MICO|nr:helix-turn-helix domain-containing protein [Cellulosimicrobium protaetiae]QJW35391.1 helix-turn-helix transcriptional regulator [Cellulosimicrobium protaetiae]
MQEPRRTNADRTRATRTALVTAARDLFVDAGYAATSTPQIAAAAHVTRGALYHHYADKRDLFRAVVEAEAEAVAREIEERTEPHRTAPAAAAAAGSPAVSGEPDARAMLVEGARAYLDAMAVPGRTRLLLVDAPAVLGATEADALDARHARRTLRAGLGAALDTARGARDDLPAAGRVDDDVAHDDRLDALTLLLSAVFDRAALALDGGAPPHAVRAAVTELVDRVCAPLPPR